MSIIVDGDILGSITSHFGGLRRPEYTNEIISACLPSDRQDDLAARAAIEAEQEKRWRMERAAAYRIARGETIEDAACGYGAMYLRATPESKKIIEQNGKRRFANSQTPPASEGVSLNDSRLSEMVDWVLKLHRHGDAFIVLGKKTADGSMRHTDAIRASKFSTLFPSIAEQYLEDAYVGLNGCYPAGAFQPGLVHPNNMYEPEPLVKPVSRKTGKSFHREENMRNLNACYCDLDGYTKDMDADQVIQAVRTLCERGELPRPTTTIRSGRGVWLLWHLHQPAHHDRSHLGCRPDVIRRWKATNRALGVKLADLGWDAGAVDAARLAGLHGMVKRSSGKQVQWCDYPGGRSYTLDELSLLAGVSQNNTGLPDTAAPKPSRQASCGPVTKETSHRQKGWNAAAKMRFDCFHWVRDRRGVFKEGLRDNAAWVYAYCFRSARRPESEAREAVRRFGARYCKDPLSYDICDQKVASVYSKDEQSEYRYGYLSFQEMADRLQLTVQESHDACRELGTKKFTPARSEGIVMRPPTQAEKLQRRRETILAVIDAYGSVLSYSEWVEALADRGVSACKGTLFTDFRILGIKTPEMAKHDPQPQIQRFKIAS